MERKWAFIVEYESDPFCSPSPVRPTWLHIHPGPHCPFLQLQVQPCKTLITERFPQCDCVVMPLPSGTWSSWLRRKTRRTFSFQETQESTLPSHLTPVILAHTGATRYFWQGGRSPGRLCLPPQPPCPRGALSVCDCTAGLC